MRTMVVLASLALATPAAAQSRLFAPADDAPAISFRPFVTVGSERFAASQTFKAVFGTDTTAEWGGGLDVVFGHGRVFAEVDASRLTKSLVGDRVFVNAGQVFNMGIPLRASIKPFDASVGVRFNRSPRIVPYLGVGFASYHYTEQSDFADASENVDTTKVGPMVRGGAEVRVSRWLGVALDLQYTSITGILGNGGASKEFGESDLGGFAAGVKFVVGR